MRVSDVIQHQEISKWKNGMNITIKSTTGSGKSYFIKNILYEYAKARHKRILVFTNRKKLKEQYDIELSRDKKTDIIDVMNYQKLEKRYAKGKTFDFSQYTYLVADETQYFTIDSSFNYFTDISFKEIIQANCIKIFMSATINTFNAFMNENNYKVKKYIIPRSFNPVMKLNFFNQDETMIKIIQNALQKSDSIKILYFCQSAKKAYEIHSEFKSDSMFLCSDSNMSYVEYVDQDKLKNMLENEKFEDRLLVTTTCLDNGVNLCDTDLKIIIVDVENVDTVVQCIGRKRSQFIDGKSKDKCIVYVKNLTNNYIGGRLRQAKQKIEMAEYLQEHSAKEFCLEYPRKQDYANLVYVSPFNSDDDIVNLKVNEIMLFNYKQNIELYKSILNSKYHNGHKLLVQNALDLDSYSNVEEEEKNISLEEYLDSIKGNPLYKLDQKELVEKINLRKDGHLVKKYAIFNTYFYEEKIPYIIYSDTDTIRKLDDGSKNPNYQKVYWTIGKNDIKSNVNIVI